MIPDCQQLIHPFQSDPGVSQRQRLNEDLLSGTASVDARSLADLLDFFIQLSRHVNYYDEQLQVSDWQPFFRKSLPFSIASIIRYDRAAVEKKLLGYKKKFDKKPSAAGLQLLLSYTYNSIILKINGWQQLIQGSALPLETAMEQLVRDKLSDPVKEFIRYANDGTKWFCTRNFNFNPLFDNKTWGLVSSDLRETDDDFKTWGNTKRKRLQVLYGKVFQLVQSFLDVIRIFSTSAELSIQQSLLPLKEELKERHTPHLALLFAFLQLFRYLQGDLNSYTRKHLDFFYKQVLLLKPGPAVPDKVHLVFEIQQQLEKYLLKKGLLFKDGKDNNKAEVLFSTDDEIVVNKTKIAEQKILFLNNQVTGDAALLEGVYMAPDVTKADGIEKAFADDVLPSRAALGAKWSKYADPENKFILPYPGARLGFLLASPVLLLNGGKREINISLSCQLDSNYCQSLLPKPGTQNTCCDDQRRGPGKNKTKKVEYPPFVGAELLVTQVATALNSSYFYISRDILAAAVEAGISKKLQDIVDGWLTVTHTRNDKDGNTCYCETKEKKYDALFTQQEWGTMKAPLSAEEKKALDDIVKPRKPLNVVFSGEDKWISPYEDAAGSVVASIQNYNPATRLFTLAITAVLQPEHKPVTFYNAENLKEDFNTTLPVAKIELDDKIKILHSLAASAQLQCCERQPEKTTRPVSLYHFFRNVKVLPASTKINVEVCGLKDFIVQNDESLQDTASPIYPFGTRPSVIGFDLVNPVKPGVPKNLAGPSFYIGSKEVFGKKWDDVYINLSWKDKPVSFNEYYKAYWVNKADQTKYGLNENDFQVNVALLEDGKWKKEKDYTVPNPPVPNNLIQNPETHDFNRPLFRKDTAAGFCNPLNPVEQTIHIANAYINGSSPAFRIDQAKQEQLNPSTLNGFIRLNLQNQDFLHKDYAYILARQMMALGKFPNSFLEDATYLSAGNTVIVFEGIAPKLVQLDQLATDAVTATTNTKTNVDAVKSATDNARLGGSPGGVTITAAEFTPSISTPLASAVSNSQTAKTRAQNLRNKLTEIETTLSFFDVFTGKLVDKLSVLIPNEPWTPIIKNISLDYKATAVAADIDLVHLYPYTGTYKAEELELQPSLFPVFCDEGNLFLGLKDCKPGSNLNILFQLAEATADSESEREELQWYYLENNIWKLLRTGFEVLDDDTNGLTTSGIVKLALPANMTNENSILPKGLHWIRAAIPGNSRSVSEIIGVHTQAVKATFTAAPENDLLRLVAPLPAGSVAKLKEADALVKKTEQPYDSFGGRVPEAEQHFYIRVSELLRHKNRAIQKFDYERIVLELFPQVYKVKCINHSYALNANRYVNDFPVAPGYVLLAVIPDLNQLKAARSFEPKAPVSLLEAIEAGLKKVVSPFVRLRIMNPRYEKVDFCLRVKLLPGKDEVYYKEELKKDISEFLAPWAIGEYDKLVFGQSVNRSDMIRFLESRGYIDYITDLKMVHTESGKNISTSGDANEVVPITPRSILVAGNIDVCIDQQDCEQWCECKDATGQGTGSCCDHTAIPVTDYCKDTGKD
jgi:hypothetical protein